MTLDVQKWQHLVSSDADLQNAGRELASLMNRMSLLVGPIAEKYSIAVGGFLNMLQEIERKYPGLIEQAVHSYRQYQLISETIAVEANQ